MRNYLAFWLRTYVELYVLSAIIYNGIVNLHKDVLFVYIGKHMRVYVSSTVLCGFSVLTVPLKRVIVVFPDHTNVLVLFRHACNKVSSKFKAIGLYLVFQSYLVHCVSEEWHYMYVIRTDIL